MYREVICATHMVKRYRTDNVGLSQFNIANCNRYIVCGDLHRNQSSYITAFDRNFVREKLFER